jgi:chromosome partitioning protein
MPVIVVGGEKGGTGKTTQVTNIAGILSNFNDSDFILVDTDKQGTAARWCDRRNTDRNLQQISCVRITGKGIPAQVKRLLDKYKIVLIDAGGTDSVELRGAMAVADLFVVTIKPSQFDVETLPKVSQLIDEVGIYNENIDSKALITMASTNPQVKEANEVKELFDEINNISLFESVNYDRKVFRDAVKEGMAVTEFMPKNEKAIEETLNIFKEVFSGFKF